MMDNNIGQKTNTIATMGTITLLVYVDKVDVTPSTGVVPPPRADHMVWNIDAVDVDWMNVPEVNWRIE